MAARRTTPSGIVSDPAVTIGLCFGSSSSDFDCNHRADRARLNFTGATAGCNGWSAGSNDFNQWYQIGGLAETVTWVSVDIQGRGGLAQYVTEFTVTYTNDGVDWFLADNGKVYSGNTADFEKIVTNYFDTPFKALALRINPCAWINHISLRAEAHFKV